MYIFTNDIRSLLATYFIMGVCPIGLIVHGVTFHTRTMHLLHGVGASAKMPALWQFVCINCCNSHQIIINQYEIWHEDEL
jgi:hypothetical protein